MSGLFTADLWLDIKSTFTNSTIPNGWVYTTVIPF